MSSMKRLAGTIATGLVLAGMSMTARAQVALHTFQAGERARASEVNGNFNNLKIAIEAAESRNLALENRIRDLEAALTNVRSLNNVLTIEAVNGARTVRLTGVNLQVVNGTNSTESINGAGNIIIGYDEPITLTATPVCSRATNNAGFQLRDEAACLAGGGVFSTQHKTGSHNLVLGSQNNYSSAGGIVAGRGNYINELYASALGGILNVSSGRGSVIVAGQSNVALERSSVVVSGISNEASGGHSAILGGAGNVTGDQSSTVGGGERNAAIGLAASVGGGGRNTASGFSSSVSGGRGNTASGVGSSILGGNSRTASGVDATLN
jgi:hypothetical protein